MKKRTQPILVVCFLALAILACNLGVSSPSVSVGSQTLTALAQSAAASSTPQSSGSSTANLALTSSATSTSTPNTTPMVSVGTATNCRTGPGKVYDLVASVDVGFKATAIGKDTADNYWLVKLPTGEQCWLWGQNATIEGDVNGLPEIPPPPAPTPQASPTPKTPPTPKPLSTPAAPTNLTGVVTCSKSGSLISSFTQMTLQLKWTDNADNETNYIITYEGMSKEIPADRTSDTIAWDRPTGSKAYVHVVVYAKNDAGNSGWINDYYKCP